MRDGIRSLLISLFLHAGVTGGGMALIGSLPTQSEAVIIDLSLMDPGCYTHETVLSGTVKSEAQPRQCPAVHQTAAPAPPLKAVPSQIQPGPAQPASQAAPSPVTTPATDLAAYLPRTPADGSRHGSSSSTPAAETSGTSRAGTAGSVEGSAEQLQQQYTREHFAYIRKIINDKIRYPRAARIRGQEGTVMVTFIIRKDGTISHPQIVSSSGYALLDEQAISAILDAAPFPRPPVAAQMRVPVVYQLA